MGINTDTFADFRYVFADGGDSVMRIDSKGNIDVVSNTSRGIRLITGKISIGGTGETSLKPAPVLRVGSGFGFEMLDGGQMSFDVKAIKPVDTFFKEPEEGSTRGSNSDMVDRFYDWYNKASKKGGRRRPDAPFIDV
jgi:hypothetical protein